MQTENGNLSEFLLAERYTDLVDAITVRELAVQTIVILLEQLTIR